MELPTDDAPATRYRVDLAYDGTDFSGWARQPGLRTVQGVLEQVLATLLRRTPPVPALVVAGRTDVGVHAHGQVCHLDLTPAQQRSLPRRRDGMPVGPVAEAIVGRVNGVLGHYSDVVLRHASEAPPGFDARFSAVWRRYEYRLADRSSFLDPAERLRTAWTSASLDVEAMDAAAATLLGLHDFAAYCRAREGATTIRTLQEFSWRRDADGVLVASVRADAFCRSMVRALVGACVSVGEGRFGVDDPERLRTGGMRTGEFTVSPARGLTLLEVAYPADEEVAARADATRARRELPDSD